MYICLIHVYKPNLEFNNLQWLICHKTQTKTKNILTIISNRFIWSIDWTLTDTTIPVQGGPESNGKV